MKTTLNYMKALWSFGFFLLALAIFGASLVSAISSNLKETYNGKETIIIELNGNIIEPISKNQVEFKRSNVNVPLEYDIKKVGDKYYLWAIAPENPNNYTLVIRNVATNIGGKNLFEDYQKDFKIDGELARYYIRPGLLIVGESETLKVTLNSEFIEKISVDFPSNREIELRPGENLIDIINDDLRGFRMIHIGIYSVPAYFISGRGDSEEDPGTNKPADFGIEIIPEIIESRMLFGKAEKYKFLILNNGQENLSDLYFDYDRKIIKIEPDEKFFITQNKTLSFNLSVSPEVNESFGEWIYVRRGENYARLKFNVNFTSNESDVLTEYYKPNKENARALLRCNEVPGVVCSTKEKCSLNTITSSDGPCCPGICLANTESKGSKAWIGYTIAGFLIIVGLYIFFKYYRVKK